MAVSLDKSRGDFTAAFRVIDLVKNVSEYEARLTELQNALERSKAEADRAAADMARLNEISESIAKREAALQDREERLSVEQGTFSKRINDMSEALEAREKTIAETERRIAARASELNSREKDLHGLSDALRAREEALDKQQAKLAELSERLEKREARLKEALSD